MIVHAVDGTYELFRHFYGLRRFTKGKDRPYGGVGRRAADDPADAGAGRDARRRGDRSRHRVVPQRPVAGLQDGQGSSARCGRSSTRSRKRSSDGRRGVADDRARSRRRARVRAQDRRRDPGVDKVSIWTVDKDLASACAATRRAGRPPRQEDLRRGRRAREVRRAPALIPDYLALVGDAADGYPGHRRHRRGVRGAAC
jgi:hypothetical protein